MRKFRGVCLISPDMQKLRQFYEDVLQIRAEGDDVFAVLPIPGAELALFSQDGMEGMAPGAMQGAGNGSFTLEFEVNDVDAETARLQAMNVVIVKPPTTQPWGLRSVWFRDPDGNLVNFYAHVAVVP